MPAKRKKERVVGTYLVWLLGQRNGVYYADGRSNRRPAGRHSLETTHRAAALEALKQLDQVQAVKLGLADRSVLAAAVNQLSLEEGRRLYLAHVSRPAVVGGARQATAKRYRPVFDKFARFATAEGISCWNQVTRQTLNAYAAWLDDQSYAYATEYLELTTLKQTVKWLVEEEHLPASCLIRLPLDKPQGTSTYCWRREEVEAMVVHCQQQAELGWLAAVLMALACTGLRISELASRRWTDFDRHNGMLQVVDESRFPKGPRDRRTTKSGRSRSFPLHEALKPVLDGLPQHADGLVFHGPLGGKLKPDTVRNVLVREVLAPLKKQFPAGEGGLGFASGRLHSFRHFFCSQCANDGIPETTVMAWLGHSDSKMVKHYFHLHDDIAQGQMRKLKLFENAEDLGAVGETA